MIHSEVKASMRKKNYSVQISVDLEEGIKDAHCTCPRGAVVCHHMAAALYYAHYNVSATDIECQWSVSKTKPGEAKIVKLKDIYAPKKEFTASKRFSTQEEIAGFSRDLGATNVVGLTWLLRPEVTLEATTFIPDIEEILQSAEYNMSDCKRIFFSKKCKVTQEIIQKFKKCTRGQHANENWQVARKHRLTASRFGMVLSAGKRNKFSPSLFKSLAEGYSLQRVAAVQWGKLHEKTALEEFVHATNLNVEETGFWLDASGFLGTSPNGLVGPDAVVEVKCPYKYRDVEDLSEILQDKSYFYWRNENDEIIVNLDHNYYHQAQGQMHITGRNKCYFVVWTPRYTDIFDIEKDPQWEANLSTLKKFYMSKYIPFILQ